MRSRALVAAFVALVLGVTVAVAPGIATPVLAAQPDLTITSTARYEVLPADALVRVTADLRATSHTTDTATRRYFFDQASLAVLPGTTGFSVTATGASPTVRVTKRTSDYTMLLISFGTKVYSGKSLDLRLRFDLPDPGGRPARDVRVGQTVATFPVWAFATDSTPGSSVEVVFPAGFTVDVGSGGLQGPTTGSDGSLTYSSGILADPLRFFSYVVADREGAYAESATYVAVGTANARIIVRAWPDDPDFGTRVGDLFERGLPALGSAIGLAYPRTEPLIARESVSRSIGGYAGVFDPSKSEIAIDYAAAPFVVLHEAAHVWFNGSLLADRWADEAFASYYAARVAPDLGVESVSDELTPELEAARIPLNAWAAIGDADAKGEAYAYAASLVLARAIADRAGDPALQAVWADAASRRSPYQPTRLGAPVELTEGAPDWRTFLDLLETRTGTSFGDLWSTWVARPEDGPALAQRADVRAGYVRIVDKAGSWELPGSIRAAMADWRFDEAAGLLAQADGVLDERTEVAVRAAAAGLIPPTTLRELFEGTTGLRAADAEATIELTTIDAFAAADASELVAPDAIESLGLLGFRPSDDLAAAARAFADGELSLSVDHAEAARAVWSSAGEVGRRRALTIGGAGLLILLIVVLAGLAIHDRRRRHRATSAGLRAAMAHRIDPVEPETSRGPGSAGGTTG